MSHEILKTVYFVRHGQSEANATPIYQPDDSPLSELGRRQAELIAGRVARLSFEALITSPLPRASATAEAIARATGKTPEGSDLFVERKKPTRLFGKSYEDVAMAKLYHAWNESVYTAGMRVEDGENYEDSVERADKALGFLLQRPEKTLVVVTHGNFFRTILARVVLGDLLTPATYKRFQTRNWVMENTSLSALKYDNFYGEQAWGVWIYNDHAHLG